ncbi:MAG: hypothetical protein HYZ15_02660 [Sphingobacteriales bacterium]|nr:hypothetical protein [Sphingobacteriales bacterium]
MKQQLHISAAFDQPALVQHLVERLACRRYDSGFSKERLPGGLKALETSSTESYVTGTLGIESPDKTEHYDMPFITSFLFTCIKGKEEPYQLIWGSSLN